MLLFFSRCILVRVEKLAWADRLVLAYKYCCCCPAVFLLVSLSLFCSLALSVTVAAAAMILFLSRVTEVMKGIAAKWRELSEPDKAEWMTKAAADKDR